MSSSLHFNADGLLPAQDFELTLAELERSLLVVGPASGYPNWDKQWRAYLVRNLRILVGQLDQAGIKDIFINGSFVEDKDHPADIDGYFNCELRDYLSGDLQRRLNLIAPDKIWTWAPTALRPVRMIRANTNCLCGTSTGRTLPSLGAIVWHSRYHGHELEFPSAFRQSRQGGKPKGIIKIGGLL